MVAWNRPPGGLSAPYSAGESDNVFRVICGPHPNLDSTTDKTRRRLGNGRRNRDEETKARKLGAPIARAPINRDKNAAATPDTASSEALASAPGEPGGRRSRAHPEPRDEGRRVIQLASAKRLRLLDGEQLAAEEPEVNQAPLKPSTATSLADWLAAMVGPVAAALYTGSVAVFVATALLVLLVRAQGRRSALTENEIAGLSPLVAGAGGAIMTLLVDPADTLATAAGAGVVALGAGALAAIAMKLASDRFVHVRLAVIGDAAAAHKLAWDLSASGTRRYAVVGYVTRTSERDNLRDLDHISFKVRRLGLIADLSHIVARSDVDMLVLATDEDRPKVFERAAVCCERYHTRLLSLSAFEEAVFRRVPIETLNSAWFQHIMHPRFRPVPRIFSRAVDIALAGFAALITLPFWGLAALIMRGVFGKPVLVRRRRIGERGRSFSLLRFRVARRQVTGEAPEEDAPAVGFGKFLRKTGIESLPTLINVLRGDMSLVGPRPLTPRELAEGESELPYYARRNLVRPGLTGWARLHGDGDSTDEYSADLFYLKHQSVMLYSYVLLATLWRSLTGAGGSAARG